ncbi:FAD-dependent oxidoreductase [Roseivivax sp. CAU 1761]
MEPETRPVRPSAGPADACDIAIIGGGLNGAALALALARLPLRVALLDKAPPAAQDEAGFDGRAYALARASVRLLERLGLWDDLAPDAQPIAEIKVSDGRLADSGTFLGLHFASGEIEDGPMGQMVEDRHLRRALRARLRDHPRIDWREGCEVTAQTPGPGGMVLALDGGGGTLTAGLAVAADGRRSAAGARAGIRRMGWDYPQTALVCALAHERPHGGVAHQLFLPSGPLAILPLAGNRVSIVWTERRGLAEEINALPDAEYLQVLAPRFGDFLGELRPEGRRHAYPLALDLAQDIVAERLALVGDAAHAVHPIAGQGLNAGLRDIAALAHVVDHARRRGEDVGSVMVLERYAAWRRFDSATLALATDGFNRLFSNDLPGLRLLRDAGMAAVNAMPGLRRAFIREAAGLTGDLPDLMAP